MSIYEHLVEDIFEQLESIIKEIPRKNLVTQADWNANVGPGAYEKWSGTVGCFEVGETN